MSKSILITGCSTGIGLCAAETLQKKGYRVFATARKPADVEKLRGMGLESLVLDVDDSQSIQHGFSTILEKTGGTLDALFSNAGYAIPGAVEDQTREMMRKQFETNVFGPMELINLVLPVMRKQGYGRIIQNTSILGVITMPFRGNYNASKFALEAFTSTLRQELRRTNIRVSIIAPGPIATRFRNNAHKNYKDTINDAESAYQSNYKKMEAHFNAPSPTEKSFTLPPDAVVKKLLHALESNSPRSRYYVGMPAHVFAFLRRILPDSGLDWVIDKSLTE
jgi:NAD(P)-dependent dehydrogenase (short-subunit alcohol dehydrogenase family)